MTCKPCIAGNHGECEIQDDDTGDVCSCQACDEQAALEPDDYHDDEEDTDYNDEE